MELILIIILLILLFGGGFGYYRGGYYGRGGGYGASLAALGTALYCAPRDVPPRGGTSPP